MFLTRKRADKEIKSAVEQVLLRVPDLTPQVDALRQQVGSLRAELVNLRADHAEREAELAREYDARLAQVLASMPELPKVVQVPVETRIEPDPAVHQSIRELDDTVRYLLEAPAVRHEVVREVEREVGVRAMFDQHVVRPMGAR